MANIGTFKKSGREFQGEIVTLGLQSKRVRIVPETDRASDTEPSRHTQRHGRGGALCASVSSHLLTPLVAIKASASRII
jgi:uncharacterized protein (DUF736 family)